MLDLVAALIYVAQATVNLVKVKESGNLYRRNVHKFLKHSWSSTEIIVKFSLQNHNGVEAEEQLKSSWQEFARVSGEKAEEQ